MAAAPATAATPSPDGTSAGCLSDTMSGDLFVTSGATAAGETLYFAGQHFVAAPTGAQTLSVKLDALSSTSSYSGTGGSGDEHLFGTVQVQADGTVAGSITLPADIEDPAVDPMTDGVHFLRLLGGSPATSCWTDGFQVADTTDNPVVTTTATVTTGRRAGVTLTVSGSGFAANESVDLSSATDDTGTVLGTLTADGDGNLSGTVQLPLGTLTSGVRQLLFTNATLASPSADENPGVADVDVPAAPAIAGAALGSAGTVTVSNLTPGSVISSVKVSSGDDASPVEVLSAPITAGDTAVATGAITLPSGVQYLGTKTFTITQSFPYAKTYTVSAKVSPSTATFGTDKFTQISSADNAVAQGLYQSAYSSREKALFATASLSTTATDTDPTSGWDGYLYKLDPDTLAVEKSVRAGFVSGDAGARYAPYGIGVDDTNGTVWVTNTRQNTVAVYAESDLHLLKQWTGADSSDANGYVNHARDVVPDPADGLVFVSSASEGSSGDGSIAVFEADDENDNGVKYEKLEDIAVHPRTDFSPMSLTLDAADHKLFTVSSTSQAAMVVDTRSLEDTIISLPSLMTGGRGASGVAYDPQTKRLFIASQNSDELTIAQLSDDLTTGTTVKEIATGAGALNVAFDPVNRLAYVANFGGTTVSVVDPDGNEVANLAIATPNHISTDGLGSVYVVNKAADNRVVKLTYTGDKTGDKTGGDTGTTNPGGDHATTPSLHDQQVAKAKQKVAKDKAKVKKLKKRLKKAHGAKATKLKKKLKKAKKHLKADKKKLKKAKK
jgi:hypothetical protein